MKKELIKVKTYNNNATVYSDEKFIDINYEADYLANYCGEPYNNEDEAIEEYRADLKAEIKEAFPNADEDNIDEVVLSIMIYATDNISTMWR